MNRRILLQMTAGLLGATALSGLAIARESAISWWYETANPDQQGYIKKHILDPFNKTHSDYKLTIDYRGTALDNQLRMALLSNHGPDIIYTAGPSYIAPMARAGQLLPLDDYAAKYGWKDRLLSVFLEMGRYSGKLYALPKTYETLGLFYNATLFKKQGWTSPKSISDLEIIADQMLKMNIIPFAAGNATWRPTNEHYVSIVLNAVAGPDKIRQALTGKLPWTAPPFVAAINKLNEWWQKGYFGPNYFSLAEEQAFAQMASGQAGMMPSGTWQFQRANTYFPRDKTETAELGFIGFPSDTAIGEPVYPLGIGSTFSIASSSKSPDGAAAAIDFILSKDIYVALNTDWQGEWNIPLRDLSDVTLGSEVSPLYTKTMQTLAAAVAAGNYGYTSWTFLPPATDSFLVSGIEEVWLGRSTTTAFLTQLDATFQQEMSEGKVPTVPSR